MSWRVALQIAESGLFAYVALWFGVLYAMRPVARENGIFALVAAGAGVSATGTALVVGAHSMADAAWGQRLVHAGIVEATGALALFLEALSEKRRPWSGPRTLALGAFASIALAGGFFDPAYPSSSYDGAWESVPSAQLGAVGVLGLVAVMFAFVDATVMMGRLARDAPRFRAAFITLLVPLASGVFDLGSRLLGGPTLHLAALGGVFLVVSMSHVLLERLVDVDTALERKTAELESAHETLRAAEKTLVRTEQLAAIGELSAVIAHEIRNPLAILKNAATGLSRERLSEVDRETLLTILDQEADRLNRLVNDLLAYASPLVPDARQVDLVELVRRAAQLALESHPQRSDIRVDVRADPPPRPAWADPALLRHALINIVDNAILAMPSGGDVTIRLEDVVRNGRRYVAIAFTDEGEGMDTIVRKRARDVFFTTRSSGTGLGLAIVDRVARVHRGFVEIDSRQSQGTTVTLYVPADQGSAPPPAG